MELFLVGRGFVSHNGATTPRAVGTRKEVYRVGEASGVVGSLRRGARSSAVSGPPGRRTRPAAMDKARGGA